MTVDALDSIEADAIKQANEAEDPEVRLKWIAIANAIQDRRKSRAETNNAVLTAKNTAADLHHQRMRFFLATFTPTVSTFIAVFALLFQGFQFEKSSKLQADQFAKSIKLQADQNEDSKWQESMKSVSFKDPQSALTGALSMQPFFSLQRYASQSRAIASSLLPIVSNVDGFDEVLAALYATTNAKVSDDQIPITGIAQTLLLAARERHRLLGTAWSGARGMPAFLHYRIESIDPVPSDREWEQSARDKVAAWEIDSVSQRLSQLWKEKQMPPDSFLENLTLEDASFNNVDFSKRDLTGSILYDACFQNANFDGADLTNTVLRHIELSGADLSNVRRFSGSTWQGTDWWQARSISGELRSYLSKRYPPTKQPSAPLTSCTGAP